MDYSQAEAGRAKALFEHKNNIVVGRARVLWATETTRWPAGWALPGGRITQSQAEAATVAMVMDALMTPRVQG